MVVLNPWFPYNRKMTHAFADLYEPGILDFFFLRAALWQLMQINYTNKLPLTRYTNIRQKTNVKSAAEQ